MLFLLDVAATIGRSSLTIFEFGIIPSVLKVELVAGVPVSYRAGSVWKSDAVVGVDGGFIGKYRYGKLVPCHCSDYDYTGWGVVAQWYGGLGKRIPAEGTRRLQYHYSSYSSSASFSSIIFFNSPLPSFPSPPPTNKIADI